MNRNPRGTGELDNENVNIMSADDAAISAPEVFGRADEAEPGNSVRSPAVSQTSAVGVEFFFIAAVSLMYLFGWWVADILGLPADSFERAELLFSCFVAVNCAAAYLAWKGLRWIPTRGLVHELSQSIALALTCAAAANLIDLGLWLVLGRTLKASNVPHFFFILAIIFATLGMFKVARLWRVRFGSGAALMYGLVLTLFGAIMYASGILQDGPGLLAKPNVRDVVSHLLYAVLNSFVATLALFNWIHSRGKLSMGIRLVSIGTVLLSLGCILFAIVSARFSVFAVASHPVHLLLGIAYMTIALGVYRIGLTVVDLIDRMDEKLPPVSPLIEIFGENDGWKLYERVLAKIRASERRLGRSLRENREKTESILALETTLQTEAKMREELHRAKEKAEAASAAKTQFLTMMSHELRTPLTAIVGYSTLMVDPPTDGLDTRDFGGRIRNSALHLQQLIDSILDFSSIESGRFRFRPSAFSLGEVVNFAKNLGETLARDTKGNRVTFSCDAPSGDLLLFTDPVMMRQILTNVIANAFKFTDSGEVRLDVTQTETGLRFSVSDTGIGVPEGEKERVFEPFFQVSRGNTRSFGGVGLGLAIVKHLTSILKGTVTLESQPGKGTRITCELPREIR